MKLLTLWAIGPLTALRLLAQEDALSIRIADETIPAGQTVQLKVELTEPKPISGGKGGVKTSKALTTIRGVAGFSPAGDLSGVATLNGTILELRCLAPSGTWGTDTDYPILTVAADVNPKTPLGSSIPLSLASQDSLFYDPSGSPYPQELKSGTLTVGGSLSIRDVDPGGGSLPAGTVVRVTGSGFEPDSKLQVDEVSTSQQTFISSSEIDFIVSGTADLSGKRVRVTNDDGERIEYYSYLRPVWESPSANTLLAAAVPIFPSKSYSSALFPVSSQAQVLTGLGLQNPNASDVTVALQLYSAAGVVLAQTSAPLSSRHAIERTLSEWLAVPTGAVYVRVAANPSIQITGLQVDMTRGVVSPIAAAKTK